jgi:ABC-2 type transport system permease protein
MATLWTLALKDLRLFLRDRLALFWSLVFPLIFGLFFGSLFSTGSGGGSAMEIAVVDDADTAGSRAFVERLAASDALQVEAVASLDVARDQVRKGDRVAYVRVRPGFSDGAFALFGRDPDDGAAVEIGVDPARSAERGYLQGLVSQSLFQGLSTSFTDPAAMKDQLATARRSLDAASDSDLDPTQRASLRTLFDALEGVAGEPGEAAPIAAGGFGEGLIEMSEVGRDERGRPRSPFELTFPSAIIWGLVGCATTFAASLVRERTAGTLLRLQVAPIGRAQLLLGKGLACFIAGLGVGALLLLIGVVALGVRIVAPGVLLLGVVCAAACFTGIMMLMSVIGKTEGAVSGGSWVIIMPLAMVGGGMIPLVAMPPWMLTASYVSPFRWAILAIEGGVWRDLTLTEVALPIGILLALALGLFAVGASIFRRG